jgi:hypothetical protein
VSGGAAAPPALSAAALAAERRRGRIAATGGIAALGCAIAAVAVSGHALRHVQGAGGLSRQLRSLDADYAVHQLALAVRVAGLALAAGFGLFLTRAISDRARDAPRALRVLAVAAPACVALAFAGGLLALHDLAGRFPAGAGGSEQLAESLVRHHTAMRVVVFGELASHVVFGVWVSLLCIWAMRVGLLPRFLAVWGIGAGLGGVLLPVGDALFLSWLGSASIVVLGFWPDGRPPAWDAGRAVPWAEVDAERARSIMLVVRRLARERRDELLERHAVQRARDRRDELLEHHAVQRARDRRDERQTLAAHLADLASRPLDDRDEP